MKAKPKRPVMVSMISVQGELRAVFNEYVTRRDIAVCDDEYEAMNAVVLAIDDAIGRVGRLAKEQPR